MTQLMEQEKPARELPGFGAERLGTLIDAGSSDLLRAKREEAFSAYQELPIPTLTTEGWRRTNPALFPLKGREALPPAGVIAEAPAVEWSKSFDVVVSVSTQGISIADPGGVLKSNGLRLLTLQQAAEQVPALVKPYLQGAALPAATNKFVALNNAFYNVGLFIHVPDGFELEKGILVNYEYNAADAILMPRLLTIAGKNSRATVVERMRSSDDATLTVVGAKELYLGESSRLRFITLQEWGAQTAYMVNEMARVERNAQVDWMALNFGGKAGKMTLGSDVAGEGTAAELDGIYLADGTQHFDQTTLQVHSSPDTFSRLLYKGVVKDKGHSVYQGIIEAKPGAIRVDAYQTNNNIVLDDGARADTIPGLLIEADDLKCSHGATIGNVDEEQVFYLRSRGLNEAEARRIVIMGFFDEVIERIPYEFIRDHAHDIITRKLDA